MKNPYMIEFLQQGICYTGKNLRVKRKEERMSDDLLTVSEVARILRVDDATVRRWVKQGVLEAVVLPHVNSRQVYRIKRETLGRVLGENDVQA
jgi:excisionase family DNA binding protein